MEISESIELVRRYNRWRRGDDTLEMENPAAIGQALDAICEHASRLERELEQERQDRKQADIDTIRALGERNDARKALDQERQLADRLVGTISAIHYQINHPWQAGKVWVKYPRQQIDPLLAQMKEASDDWRKSRNEPARFRVPGESCPECGNDLSVRDHGDGRVYDGDECRCCECAFMGYLSVDEDGQTLVNEYQADEAVDPP